MSMNNIHQVLSRYPKKRPKISEELARIYERENLINRGVEGGLLYKAIQKLERWGHKQISKVKTKGPILELGPGTLNHVKFENHTYAYDVVEPNDFFYKGSKDIDRIRNIYKNILDIDHDASAFVPYDRIFSKGVLEHIEDLPVAIAKSGLLLAEDGIFQHAIPSEGGFLWGLSWRCTTGLAFRLRTGMKYKELMRHEHAPLM